MDRREFFSFTTASAGLSVAGVPLSVFAASPSSIVNVALQPEPATLMLALNPTAPTQLVAGNIYEGLLRYDQKLNPQPSLATSWSTSTDGMLWNFQIKKNVKWHDGKPLTAADVVFSLDVFLRKVAARFRTYLNSVEHIKQVDPFTVQIKMKERFAPLLGIFQVGGAPIVPKHIYEGKDYASNPANATPIGTGPYRFKEWVKGSYIKLEANPDYHVANLPEIQSLVFHIIPDAAARANAFGTGAVDVLPGGSVELFDAARLATLPGATLTTQGWEMFSPHSWLWLNNRIKPMDSKAFRQGVSCALNRAAMAKVVWSGYAKSALSPFNSNVAFFNSAIEAPAFNLEKAKKLIAASGYGGETLRLLVLPYGETWQRLAEMTKQNLAQAGVKVNIVSTDVAGWTQRMGQWDYDMAFTYIYQYGDPALGVARNYTTESIVKGSPFNNVAGYSNPRLDELFMAGEREIDRSKRKAIYDEVQGILAEDVPVAWLHELSFPTIYRAKIRNIVNSGIGLNDSFARASVS